MIPCEINEITESDLKALISVPVMENDRIEYKQELQIAKDDQKRKFLTGIAAFANGSGGDIVFGMAAESGRPTEIKELANFDPDQGLLQIRDLILSGIEPSIYTVQVRPVELSNGGHVLVIRISKSWAGPHMVTYNGENRFFIRHGGGRRPMQVSEIRSSFTVSDGIQAKLQKYRLQRIGDVLADNTPCPLKGKAALMINLVPFSAMDAAAQCDVDAVRSVKKLRPMIVGGWGHYYDVEGLFIRDGGVQADASGYLYAFRNGAIEVLDTNLLNHRNEKRIHAIFEKLILEDLPNWLAALRTMKSEAPVAIMLTLLNIRGFSMRVDAGLHGLNARPTNRDQILTRPTVLDVLHLESEDRSSSHNVFDVMRPHFDTIWNACGFSGSPLYDEQGDWNGWHMR